LVVGWSFSNDATLSDGFIYDPSTDTYTDVTPGSGYGAIVQGINRFGRIAGSFVQPSPRTVHGLVAQASPINVFGAIRLPFANHFQVNGAFTRARGINDFGVTTGFFTNSDGLSVGYVGNDSLGYEILLPPGADAPGISTVCTGINNLGQVACDVFNADFSTNNLFIGTPRFEDD
jgi:hypothetical protein